MKNYRNTRIWRAWRDMKTRCNNPNAPSYSYCGAKSITYEESWEDFKVFLADNEENYNKHVKKYGDDTFLGRKDTAKDYTKENTEWVTRKRLTHNRKLGRTNRHVVRQIRFESMSYSKIAKKYNISKTKVSDIINYKSCYKNY